MRASLSAKVLIRWRVSTFPHSFCVDLLLRSDRPQEIRLPTHHGFALRPQEDLDTDLNPVW
jgi:hypothetical protein